MTRKILILCTLPILTFSLLITACSDSDDPVNPGGGGNDDTTAPQVSGTDPQDGDTGVGQGQSITITFNEAMDPDSDDGQVALSAATVTTTTWSDDRNLVVEHDGWAEGEHVTVTVGTGLADAAGNALAAPYVFDFYVYSSVLKVLETNPVDGATGVNRSAIIQVLFSQDLLPASVVGNVTISDGAKVDYPFEASIEGSALVLDPVGELPPETAITVTLGQNLASTQQATLGTDVTFGFTTGMEVDNTPPTVVSVTPAIGSTFAPDIGSLQITFSEPMDPTSFEPGRWNVEFAYLVLQTQTVPTWSPDYTTVTVALPSPLPAGLPCEVSFAGLTDANGVVQPVTWTWEATVAGTPDYFPSADGDRYVFDVARSGGILGDETPTWTDSGMEYLEVADQGAGEFRLVRYGDPFVTPTGEYDVFQRSADRIAWVGFAEDMGGGVQELRFTSPLTILPLPPAAGTWNGSASVTIPGEGTYDATLSASIVGPLDFDVENAEPDQLFFKDTYRVIRTLDVEFEGALAIVETDTFWYSPTLGAVRSQGVDEEFDINEWYREQRWRVFDVGK